MYKVIYEVESAAFRDGYELAMGFANGPCKKLFCSNVDCSAIQPGGKCRFPLQSRSSMEGCGMRAMEMARNVGWNIFPAGHTSSPEQVPYLLALGLVMID
jgi:predicted metal-binding protein